MEQKIDSLVKDLQNDDLDISSIASQKLCEMGKDAIPELLKHLYSENWEFRFRVVNILSKVGVNDIDSLDIIGKAVLHENDDTVKLKMIEILQNSVTTKLIETYDPKNILDVEKEKFKKIECFSQEESLEIKEILQEKNIAFNEYIMYIGHSNLPDHSQEHVFEVLTEDFKAAIEIILEYFGLTGETDFTGECPACTTYNEKVQKCKECDLNLAFNPIFELIEHPFIQFLAQNKLLKIE